MENGPPTDRINSFALVNYIADPLGDFLTRLREELVPGCVAASHVTVLPPRPLEADPLVAGESIRPRVESHPSFLIEITGMEIFATTSVVYASIGKGRRDLRTLHQDLNAGLVYYDEPFPYHPHITLVQNVDPVTVPALFEMARRRWEEESPNPRFVVDRLHFVQNTVANRWVDLVTYELDAIPVGRW